MANVETFKVRQQRVERLGKAEVVEYETLPREFRIQAIHICDDVHEATPGGVWKKTQSFLARELGKIPPARSEDPRADCSQFLLESEDPLAVLSLIEYVFRVSSQQWQLFVDREVVEKVTEELNQRFLEHSLGYQFQSGQIVRMDSDYLHAEAVEPALSLLASRGFEGPREEFLKAHKHYREGNHREAIGQALNAFESTMKVICDKRRVRYDQRDTASRLIDKLIADGVIPRELQSEFQSLQKVLSDGVLPLRNSKASHGQGAKVVKIPGYLTSYVLHMTASNIVFLSEASRDSHR